MRSSLLYRRLPTEQPHPNRRVLDQLSTVQRLGMMHQEDARAVRAVGRALPQIARAVELIAASLRLGGRLCFVGAGTSGRLGVLEAAECPPTFGIEPERIQAVMAGGPQAVFHSQEDAEDRRDAARADIRRRVRAGDVVIGISASGVTPFVDGALRTARALKAHTVLITCHPRSPIRAEIRIALAVGPELLAGSTRLKAGTATKLVLNMLTLGSMARWGRTHGHLMVDVKPTSRKLQARAVRIIQELARCSEARAVTALKAARGHVKVAALMASEDLP